MAEFRAYSDEVYSRFGVGRFENENCKNKVFIESVLYESAKRYGVSGNALVISGPALDRHLGNAYKVADEVTVVELSPKEFYQITTIIAKNKKYCSLVNRGKLMTRNMDVGKVNQSYDFEDLDLTQHLKTTQGLYIKRLARQSTLHAGPKAMIMTFSMRCGRVSEDQSYTITRINAILSVLDAKINGFNGVLDGFPDCSTLENIAKCKDKKGYVYNLEANFEAKGRVDNFVFLKYRDGGPMTTCLVLYK